MLRHQVDGMIQLYLGTVPLLSRQTDDTPGSPGLSIIGVLLQTLLQGIDSLRGILHLQIDVGPHVPGLDILTPASLDSIQFA